MVFEQSGVQFCDGRASAGAESEVAGIVVDDLVESGHIESDVVAGGRHADAEFGARAAGDEGKFFKRGKADDFGDLFGGSGYCNSGGNDFVHGIAGPGGGIGENTRTAEDGFQCGGEIGGCFDHGAIFGRKKKKTTRRRRAPQRRAEKTRDGEIMRRSDGRRIEGGRGFRRSLC